MKNNSFWERVTYAIQHNTLNYVIFDTFFTSLVILFLIYAGTDGFTSTFFIKKNGLFMMLIIFLMVSPSISIWKYLKNKSKGSPE